MGKVKIKKAKAVSLLIILLSMIKVESAAQPMDTLTSFAMPDSVYVTIDRPFMLNRTWPTIIVFYALPNGNNTGQTLGKKMKAGDDWHFDIQHIRAQTRFVRKELHKVNLYVVLLENNFKSWPAWKQRHPNFRERIPQMVDTIAGLLGTTKKEIYLNGHSGGGSFIFGYLDGVTNIPSKIKRISFLDSDYGYDSTYYPKLKNWLKKTKHAALNVFAYNDSIALYNGKPFVSATGGTWYRSHLMLRHLEADFRFEKIRDDSIIIYSAGKDNIRFLFKTNPERKIFHTTQVELNGFIHSILLGTRAESKRYSYYGPRVYEHLIE